jgi:hypothetical protein
MKDSSWELIVDGAFRSERILAEREDVRSRNKAEAKSEERRAKAEGLLLNSLFFCSLFYYSIIPSGSFGLRKMTGGLVCLLKKICQKRMVQQK